MNVLEELQGRRTVTLTSGINEKQAGDLRHRLLELDLASGQEILLLIDSDGGYAHPAFSVYDMISSLRSPVTGIVVGQCYSMATVILQACGKRMALENATFFLHFINSELEFSHRLPKKKIRALFERRYREGRDSQRKAERVIAARAGRPAKEIRKLMRAGDELQARFCADEAKKIGLIDGIIENPRGLFAQ